MDNLRDKKFRGLEIYDRLRRGERLVKEDLANEYGVSLKTIQRDIDELRAYLFEKKDEIGEFEIIVKNKEYIYTAVSESDNTLTQQDILALSKILLESRAFNKKEMSLLLKKLQNQLSRESKIHVRELINNEDYYYTELQHGKDLLEVLWSLSNVIRETRIITFDYTRMDKKQTKKEVRPISIMFSEFYFYLIAYGIISEEDVPLVFRIDRMSNIKYKDETFYILYRDRFEDGEFRKRIQFMYGGRLERIRFEYSGYDVDAILDRLPTAKIESEKDGKYIIKAEVFGNGIDMWLRSQGENVRVIENDR